VGFAGLNGPLLSGNLSKKVGGEAPHLFPIGFPLVGGRSDPPKTDDFRTDFLNIKNAGPLGSPPPRRPPAAAPNLLAAPPPRRPTKFALGGRSSPPVFKGRAPPVDGVLEDCSRAYAN
jgi:hypothetical protein